MSEMLIPFIEDVTPSIYKSMPGIRAQGLDVGATKNKCVATNNVLNLRVDGEKKTLIESFESAAVPVGWTSTNSNATYNSITQSTTGVYDGTYSTRLNIGWSTTSAQFVSIKSGTIDVSNFAVLKLNLTLGTVSASLSSLVSVKVNGVAHSIYGNGQQNTTQVVTIDTSQLNTLDIEIRCDVAAAGSSTITTYITCYVDNIAGYVSEHGYLLKTLTRLNLDRITFPKIYKPANTKCQVDILGASIRANTTVGGGVDYIDLDAGASAVDDFYNGNTIVLKTLTGSGQTRVITDYVGSSKRAYVTGVNWTTNPTSGTTFEIFGTIQSNISPGFDFSTIDYTVYPTVNVLCSLERLTGATASPSMGAPIVTSIEPIWKSQTPVVSANSTTTYTTAVSISGRARLDSISSFTAAAGGTPWVRITIDGVVWATDLVVGSTTANANYVLPFNLECDSSMLIEHKSAGAFSSSVAISWSR